MSGNTNATLALRAPGNTGAWCTRALRFPFDLSPWPQRRAQP